MHSRFEVTRKIAVPWTEFLGGSTPKRMGVKNALVVGVNYEGSEEELEWPEDEAHNVAGRLRSLGYKIVNDGAVVGKDANLENVIRLLENKKETLAEFHFSGHGSGSSLSL